MGLSQWAHDVKMTSYQRRCDVMTSQRRRSDVIVTSCACWVGTINSISAANLWVQNKVFHWESVKSLYTGPHRNLNFAFQRPNYEVKDTGCAGKSHFLSILFNLKIIQCSILHTVVNKWKQLSYLGTGP